MPLELTFIASAFVTRVGMRCYGHMAHGTSLLYTSVRSLRDLHSLGPSALGCVNSVETCTSVYNLYLLTSTIRDTKASNPVEQAMHVELLPKRNV